MDPSSNELLPATRRALLRQLAVAQVEGRAPSLVAAVTRAGAPVWTGARGDVDGREPDSDTQYRIGSITKTFIAVLIMRLRDEGRLDLADRLDRHLPGVDVGGAGEATIAQLLSHSSGLTAEPPGPWWERTPGSLRPDLPDLLHQPPTRHPAGRVFHYSNVGYGLLGAVVERARGAGWAQVTREELLEPLGMRRTTPLPQPPHAHGFAVHPWADALLPEPAEDAGRMAPAGQLWSTTADLCRWATFLAAGHEGVLAPTTLAEMRAAGSTAAEGTGYGLGLQLLRAHGIDFAGHTGSMPGFLAALWHAPSQDVAAVVLANTTTGVGIGTLAADLAHVLVEHEPPVPPPWRPLAEVSPDLLALTGPWYWGPTAFTLRLTADRGLVLRTMTGVPREAPLRAEADGTWTALGDYWRGETLRIVRAPDGGVSHLDLGTFVLTREPYPLDGPTPGGVDPAGWRAG